MEPAIGKPAQNSRVSNLSCGNHAAVVDCSRRRILVAAAHKKTTLFAAGSSRIAIASPFHQEESVAHFLRVARLAATRAAPPLNAPPSNAQLFRSSRGESSANLLMLRCTDLGLATLPVSLSFWDRRVAPRRRLRRGTGVYNGARGSGAGRDIE